MQQLIDDLPEEIAILDLSCNILTVNRAWREATEAHGYNESLPGNNYRDVCAKKASEGYDPAIVAVPALDDLSSGKRSYWQLHYNGGERWNGRDYEITIRRIADGGQIFLLVTRFDLTELMELRRVKENFSKSLIEGRVMDRGADASFTETVCELVNGFNEQAAIVDEDWRIIAVNEPWQKFSEEAGYPELKPGLDYVAFLKTHCGKGYSNAEAVAAGVDAIRAGTMNSFELTYAGVDHWQGRTLHLRINRLHLYGRALATISREDVTAATELHRLREEFSDSVSRSQVEERRRLGRELHDSTAQLLAAIGLLLGGLKRQLPDKKSRGVFAELQGLLSEAQQEIRLVSYLSHPPVLEKMGLPGALKSLIKGFKARTGLEISFAMHGEPINLSPLCESALYRIAQEALSNVHRHARAKRVRVFLFYRGGATHLVISDDGIGISRETLSGRGQTGVGLASMRSRLSEIGARLTLRTLSPGAAILASVPRR
jgi:signal transduction histidine kinase